MKLAAWVEHLPQRPIKTGSDFIVAAEGDTVIILVARKGEPVFGLIDEILARFNAVESAK